MEVATFSLIRGRLNEIEVIERKCRPFYVGKQFSNPLYLIQERMFIFGRSLHYPRKAIGCSTYHLFSRMIYLNMLGVGPALIWKWLQSSMRQLMTVNCQECSPSWGLRTATSMLLIRVRFSFSSACSLQWSLRGGDLIGGCRSFCRTTRQ